MSAEQIALKPCPECRTTWGREIILGRPVIIECGECGHIAEGKSEAEAIAAWNTRAQETTDAQ